MRSIAIAQTAVYVSALFRAGREESEFIKRWSSPEWLTKTIS